MIFIIILGDFLNYKICGYYLDSEQQAIVFDESKHLLVVAGAGSGKTLTILGKINYLVNIKKIDKDDILCISFTREASLSLKNKIKKEFNFNMNVYTFHKLALEILKEKGIKYEISASDTLDNIIHEFLYVMVLSNERYMRLVLRYFRIKYKSKDMYLRFLDNNNKKMQLFERLISTFIHLFKCKGYNLSSFGVLLKKAKRNIFNYRHQKAFLTIALNIYLTYEGYLEENQELDFDDMIIMATNEVDQNGLDKKYKYIIIDEYQDTSYVRFLLVQKILNKTGASLMVVGDDFQSIYKFTGCELSLFLNFEDYFKDAKVMKIQNTYRNSQELINIAGNFVMKNKKQIRKNLTSNKHIDNPVKIVYYNNIKKAFLELILKVYKKTNKPILVLGRNNKDINLVLDFNYFKIDNDRIIYLNDELIKIRYLTVHKSKGLEEENVVIINLENKLLGFPNKIIDYEVLKLLTSNVDKYPYSEERRLFYVALTRTKNSVYLLVPNKNQSVFVEEIKNMIKSK